MFKVVSAYQVHWSMPYRKAEAGEPLDFRSEWHRVDVRYRGGQFALSARAF